MCTFITDCLAGRNCFTRHGGSQTFKNEAPAQNAANENIAPKKRGRKKKETIPKVDRS